MNVYVCTNHNGHNPVGVASIVVAESIDKAYELLDEELKEHGLQPYAEYIYTLQLLDLNTSVAIVLRDGDY